MRLRRLFFDDFWPESAAEAMKRTHARWLTRALRSPRSRSFRIPTRRVDAGGFEELVRTEAGRAWADRWWSDAMQAADDMTKD